MIQTELAMIKKIYGEKMMHLCRELFPTILETPFLLLNILNNKIAPTRGLGLIIINDQYKENFKNYIYSFIDKNKELPNVNKNPFELLKEAGYNLYECHNQDEIEFFKQYYAKNEEICTFYDKQRLDKCHVFFAVKNNVDAIKREDFLIPNREDDYGRSVISIQFSKGEGHTLSIKNRYNHTVLNPDATFFNNLENIIPGLTKSFEEYCGFEINQDISDYTRFLRINNYTLANDGRYYRFNYEINGIYYCENNIIIDNGKVIKKYFHEKERYILVDYIIIDKKEKKVFLYDNQDLKKDAFLDSINEIGEIKNITSVKSGKITIEYVDGKRIYLSIDNRNVITSYENIYVKKIGDNFLWLNQALDNINLENVEEIGIDFLKCNTNLTIVNFPNVLKIGGWFLCNNNKVYKIELPKVKEIGICFFNGNSKVEKIELPNIIKIGDYFMFYNRHLSKIYAPKAVYIGDSFLYYNSEMEEISLPNVVKIGDNFMNDNVKINKVNLSSLEEVGSFFFHYNNGLIQLDLENLRKVNVGFMRHNEKLTELYAPNLVDIGYHFLNKNPNFNCNCEDSKGYVKCLKK